MPTRFFISQTSLDSWIVGGSVDVRQDKLTVVAEGRHFELVEAVYVLREVGGSGDPHELIGRVKSRAYLDGLGAEIVESSMLVGDAAYDVKPGWMGTPIGDFDDHLRSIGRQEARRARPGGAPTSDEELLARLAAGSL